MGISKVKTIYDPALFQGTAKYYARYRQQYPRELFLLLKRKLHLDGRGRLLDLGCGTGELAIPLLRYFEEVIAVDPDKSMLAQARRKARENNAANIKWILDTAENIDKSMGKFRLITIGRAFHWMNKELVLKNTAGMLEDGGGIAIITSPSEWSSSEAWKRDLIKVVKCHLGPKRLAGTGTYKSRKKSFESALSGHFRKIQRYRIEQENKFKVDEIIGRLYSTSFASPRLFGKSRKKFETDVRKSLLRRSPEGVLRERTKFYVFFARKESSAAE